MKELGKGMILVIVLAALLYLHNQKRKEKGISLTEYGKQILGLGDEGAERKQYLDKLRFLAAVLVVFVHSMQSAAAQIKPFASSSARLLWYGLTGAAGLGLCCNLLFILISGALLLPCREEKAGVFYCKRISKVLIPLAAYYLFYLRRSGLLSFSFSSVMNALGMVISGPVELVPHFWLVYVLTGLYLGVPFLRWMLKELPDALLEGMALVIVLGAAGKTVLYCLGIGFPFDSFLFSWEGIFLLGYFFTQPCSRKYRKMVMAGGGISGAAIVILSCTREDASVIAANDSFLMILFSLAVFLAFRSGEKRRKNKQGKQGSITEKIIHTGSRYSYSILLIHWFMLFVVAEKHLHVGPFMFGRQWILAGVAVQSLLALLFSLLFALIYDQTVVFLLEWVWNFLQKIRKIRF